MNTLKFEVKFPNDNQMNEFIKMLAWMDLCGNVGHCTDFLVTLDGDGSARLNFNFESEELQKKYDELRQTLLEDEYKHKHKPISGFIDIHICIE